jgi:hypothetical protein
MPDVAPGDASVLDRYETKPSGHPHTIFEYVRIYSRDRSGASLTNRARNGEKHRSSSSTPCGIRK